MLKYAILITILVALGKYFNKSFLFKTFRIYVINVNVVLATKVGYIMQKIKWIYRVIIELIFIWGSFEWREGVIAVSLAKFLKVFWVRTKKMLYFISPYARKWLHDDQVSKWMKYYSVVLILLIIYLVLVYICRSKQKMRRLVVSCIIIFADSYIGLGLAKLITCVLDNNSLVAFSVFIVGCILIHIGVIYFYARMT